MPSYLNAVELRRDSVLGDGVHRPQRVRLRPDADLPDLRDEGGLDVHPRLRDVVHEGPVLEVNADPALVDLVEGAADAGDEHGQDEDDDGNGCDAPDLVGAQRPVAGRVEAVPAAASHGIRVLLVPHAEGRGRRLTRTLKALRASPLADLGRKFEWSKLNFVFLCSNHQV